MTRFSPFVERVGGAGAQGWAVHAAARAAQRRGEDVIILSVGDPEFATPVLIVDRAVEALRSGDTHYAEIRGRGHLRRAIAGSVNGLSKSAWTADNVIVCGGTQNALFNVSLCLLGPGDEVIVSDPSYLTYEATLRAGGATLVTAALTADGGFRLDPSAIGKAVTPRTKAIMLNSPANPTGVVADVAEIAAIAEIARANHLWIISDEVYAELVFDGEHHSIGAHHDLEDHTVIVGAVSKSHAMTGWRIGWACGPQDLIAHMETTSLAMTYGLPGFIQEAAAVALENHGGDVAEMRETYRRRRDLVAGLLGDAQGINVLSPQAGMFVLADVRGTGLSSHDFAWKLFQSTGVSVLDAANFGPAAEGWVRISFTISDDDLAEGCRRIKSFCSQL